MKTSDSITNIAPAFLEAQKLFDKASKNKTAHGKKFDYDYSTLTEVFSVCIAALHENNISVLQPTKFVDGNNVVETILLHSCGEWLSSDLSIKSEQQTPQGEGSALTYCRRYALSSMVGICSDDDDGKGAMPKDKQPDSNNPDTPACPKCGSYESVITEKFSGVANSWLCYAKRGGCGNKWTEGLPENASPETVQKEKDVVKVTALGNIINAMKKARGDRGDEQWEQFKSELLIGAFGVDNWEEIKMLGISKLKEGYDKLVVATPAPPVQTAEVCETHGEEDCKLCSGATIVNHDDLRKNVKEAYDKLPPANKRGFASMLYEGENRQKIVVDKLSDDKLEELGKLFLDNGIEV